MDQREDGKKILREWMDLAVSDAERLTLFRKASDRKFEKQRLDIGYDTLDKGSEELNCGEIFKISSLIVIASVRFLLLVCLA